MPLGKHPKSVKELTCPLEAAEHKALIERVRLVGYIDRHFIHVANEGKRSPWVARTMGIKRGFPDFFLFLATEHWHGLAIELKRQDGAPTPSQEEWLKRLANQHYQALCAYGWRHAWSAIELYLQAHYKYLKTAGIRIGNEQC
jgi:hypothetical protein